MHIGDEILDGIYSEVIVPALRECGLEPRRIDLDNEGGLLNAEIMASIERSDILVADLTNERPNCYLEVGYALGLGRSRNLILTVREDHLPGQPSYDPDGHRVHFDLAGYDLLLWDQADLAAFGDELVRRVRRRLLMLDGSLPSGDGTQPAPPWYAEQRDAAIAEIQSLGGRGFMEASFKLLPPKLKRKQSELLDAARAAEIHTFGWPIGLVLDSNDDRPKPTGSSIRASIHAPRFDGEASFDFWELRTDGDYFMVQSLFEDQRGHSDRIFFNTRIVRVTEAIIFCGRLYDRLGVAADHEVSVTIGHGGLAGRTLDSANRAREVHPRTSATDTSTSTVTFRLGEIDSRLVGLVTAITSPIFELFDFFELSPEVYQEIIDAFVQGRVV
jgi:hypothetical protein